MVFTPGARQRGAELAITKRAAKRRNAANDPKHEQRKPRLNICQLKTKAGEDARANDVGNNDGRCRNKTDGSPRRSRLHGTRFNNCSHLQIDNPKIIGSSEFFRSGVRIHNWQASCAIRWSQLENSQRLRIRTESRLQIFLSCQKPFPASR